MENPNNNQMGDKVCHCKHHKVMPWLIILIGLTFLLGNVGVFTVNAVNVIWPVLLVILGASKLCRCCSNK